MSDASNKSNLLGFDLDDTFEEMMRRAYHDVAEHSVQYRESRRIFYAGAAAVFFHTIGLANLSDEQGEEQLSALQKQIEDFYHHRLGQDKD